MMMATTHRAIGRLPDRVAAVSTYALEITAPGVASMGGLVNGCRDRWKTGSPTHPIEQVKHPVALNHHVRIVQQVLRIDRPEVALAGPEHDGCDVHSHLVDQARGKHLATNVDSGDLDDAVTREFLRPGDGYRDTID